jgi:DUF1365 family protein
VSAQPQIGFGQVRHARLRPARHAFAYPTCFLLLPLRSLHAGIPSALRHNRPGALSFWDKDHGDGRANALEWLDELLRGAGIEDADGEAWLHCYPRVLGYAFKPVSFWYCHRRDGSLRAIVVEVNNTFGERHCYLLDEPRFGHELEAAKVFHVSPFCRVEGRYRFRFLFTPERDRTVVRIDHDDSAGPLLQTSVSGQLQPLTAAAARRALWRHPLMTLAVIARIHWQAVRLAVKRVPFFSKPDAPAAFVTRP